jgi:hypothetical protein
MSTRTMLSLLIRTIAITAVMYGCSFWKRPITSFFCVAGDSSPWCLCIHNPLVRLTMWWGMSGGKVYAVKNRDYVNDESQLWIIVRVRIFLVGSRSLLLEKLTNRLIELALAYGLRHIAIHTSLEALLTVPFHGACSHGNDRRMAS